MYVDMGTIIAVCAGLITVGGALALIWKWVRPAIKFSAKVHSHDKTIDSLVADNGLMLECMVVLLDDSSEEARDKMKKKLINHLANRGREERKK